MKIRKILLKILLWIKCHILNRHTFIKNNYGLDEEFESLGIEGYIVDNDTLGDICNYYECQYCDSPKIETFQFTSNKYLLDKSTINRILHLKRVYKLNLEKRIVLMEKIKK